MVQLGHRHGRLEEPSARAKFSRVFYSSPISCSKRCAL
jgi:hypothetical protein